MTGIGWLDAGFRIFNFFILAFAILVMLSYLVLAIISSFSLKAYLQKNRYINYGACWPCPIR
jgi:hypothetical protein